MASIKAPDPVREAAGYLCVAALRCLRRLPPGLAIAALRPLLSLYPLLRPAHARRLRACFGAAPFPISLAEYYRNRLAGLVLGLGMHGRVTGVVRSARQEGLAHYLEALAGGSPVALLGLHMGPFELLHRLPEAPVGRPFRILTAPAFARSLTAFMAAGREGSGKRILWVGGQGQRSLERGLRETAAAKGVLALMVDQHPGDKEAVATLDLWDRVRVPWPARLLGFLASQGFVFVPVSARMQEDGTAVVRYHEPIPAADGASVKAFLEAAIEAAPSQWNWSYPKVAAVPARNPARPAEAASPARP